MITRILIPSLALAALSAAEPGKTTSLPATVYADNASPLWIPSGWMGETAAISLTADAREQPHSGATVMKITYSNGGGWGGVVWQSPANDWGEQAGGYNLTGAKALKLWARGAAGGEKVKFGFGVIGADKPFPDSAKKELSVELGKEWKEYAIDVAGLDLTRVKTGFMWVVGGQGAPVSFFLDDVRWE